MAKLDHGITLLRSIEARLLAAVPLAGGWHSTRLKMPTYPVGYIDLTGSTPVRGDGYYREEHRGVISVYTRAAEGQEPNPYEAFTLSKQAHFALSGGVASVEPGFQVTQFSSGELTPRNDDATWGRAFIFTAITHEVQNG